MKIKASHSPTLLKELGDKVTDRLLDRPLGLTNTSRRDWTSPGQSHWEGMLQLS